MGVGDSQVSKIVDLFYKYYTSWGRDNKRLSEVILKNLLIGPGTLELF